MKLHRLKRTVAILACVFVLGGIAAIGAGAEDAAYAPNRSLTISNVSASTAALRMSVLPRNIGALDAPNGPYHVWARMNIENLEAINTGTDAEVSLAVKYGYFPAGGSDMVYNTVNLRTWTADTDGFVDMVTRTTRSSIPWPTTPASPVSPISPGSRAANPASCGLRSSAAATPPSGLTPRVKTPTFPTTC